MRLYLRADLPFVCVTVTYRGVVLEVPDVLVDTGSASTVLAADTVATIGLVPERGDTIRTLRGIGGREVVFARRVDRLAVGDRGVDGPVVEIAGMDYGFAIRGILGMDFLRQTGALIDLDRLTLDCLRPDHPASCCR